MLGDDLNGGARRHDKRHGLAPGCNGEDTAAVHTLHPNLNWVFAGIRSVARYKEPPSVVRLGQDNESCSV